MHEIVEGVVRDRDLVAKLRIQNFFPGMFVGDSRKFMLVKFIQYMYICGAILWQMVKLRKFWKGYCYGFDLFWVQCMH